METIILMAFGAALGSGLSFLARKVWPPPAPTPAPAPAKGKPSTAYRDFANNYWAIEGTVGKTHKTVVTRDLNLLLHQDIREALWEIRDAMKEQTAYLKQVYGDPDDVG